MKIGIGKHKHRQARSESASGLGEKPGSRRIKRVLNFAIIASIVAGGALTFSSPTGVQAAACTAPTADNGVDTLTFNAPADATYTVWTRMIAADASNNSINLEVDGSNCYNVGGGSFSASTWGSGSSNWVNWVDGAVSSPIALQLTTGQHTLKYVGTKGGVSVDRVIVSSDTTCIPEGVGTNCQSGDSTPPTVSLIPPAPATGIVGDVVLKATASDTSGIASVDFLINGEVVGSADQSPYEYTWKSSSVANGQYTLTVQATDSKGNTSTSSPVTITTSNTAVCTGNPSVPANVRISGSTASSVTLAWDASTPAANCSIKSYTIYRDGAQISTSRTTTFQDTGLVPGASHSYTVAAVDAANHASAQSAPASASTGNDSQAPTVPTNLHTALITSSSVALAWNASSDNTAVTSYVVYRNGTQVGVASSPAYTDSNVTPNTTYSYTVAAVDAAGNKSAQSAAISAATINGPAVGGKRMYLNPSSGNYAVGSTLTVAVRADSETEGVSTAQVDLAYSSNLEFQSVDVTGSNYSGLGGCPADLRVISSGKIGLTCFYQVVNGQDAVPLTGDKLIANVTFKVLTAGTGTIDIQDTSAVLSVASSTDVLSSRQDGTYTLGGTPANPPSPPPSNPQNPPSPPPSNPPNPPSPPPSNPPSPPPSNPNPTPNPPARVNPPASLPATNRPASSPATSAATNTTVAPTGNSTPVTLPNDSQVELSDPVIVQTVPDTSQSVQKVEYYLNGKLIATIKEPPYSYSVQTKNLRNGTYTLTTRTYYEDGTVDTKNASMVVKNPMSFKQIMLQIGKFAWIIVLLLIGAAGAVWYFFFRDNNGGGFDDDDSYMFGPNGPMGGDPNGGAPQDPMNPGGPTYGPPPPPAGGSYSGMTLAPELALSGSYATPSTFGRY